MSVPKSQWRKWKASWSRFLALLPACSSQMVSELRADRNSNSRTASTRNSTSAPADVSGTYLTQCSFDQSVLPVFDTNEGFKTYGCRIVDKDKFRGQSYLPEVIKVNGEEVAAEDQIGREDSELFGEWDYIFKSLLPPEELKSIEPVGLGEDNKLAEIQTNALGDKVALKERDEHLYFTIKDTCDPTDPLEDCESFCSREAKKIGLGRDFRTFPSEWIVSSIDFASQTRSFSFYDDFENPNEGLRELTGRQSLFPKNAYNDEPEIPNVYTYRYEADGLSQTERYQGFGIGEPIKVQNLINAEPFLCLSNH